MAYQILAKDGRPILKDGDPVRAMDYTVEKIEQLDDKMKSFVAVASTEDEDRDKDIVRTDGWDLKNYKKNPMIPWSHDYWEPPIARSLRTWVDKESKRLLFKPQFDENDDKSMKIFNKYKNGFLTSFSVGFRGLEFSWRDEENKWGGGIEFTKQELLEISGVTIPANPNASINMNGVDADQLNMMQLGYPTVFAETESGLFYPIREELAEFINPEIKTLDEFPGVQAVYANSITNINDGNTGDPIPVGYYFDPETWNTGDIKGWINDHTEKTYKLHYYDWKWMEKDKKDFEVEEKSADKEVTRFDEPVKIQKSDDEDAVIDDEQADDELNVIGDTIERIMTDNMMKLTESLASAFDEIFDKILIKLDDIKKLVSEKEVDSDQKIDDNTDDEVETDDPDKSQSENDDAIEIDDSLLSPNDDKSNSDETIEIDDDLLESKTVAETVNNVFREKLKETFKSVKADKSIK